MIHSLSVLQRQLSISKVLVLAGLLLISLQVLALTESPEVADEPLPDVIPEAISTPELVSEPISIASPEAEASAVIAETDIRHSNSGLRLKEDPTERPRPVSGQSVLQMLGGLIAVLVLFAGFVWVLRQLQGKLPGQSARIRIEATMALGTREKLVIVEVDQQRLLLGVTAQQINCLRVLSNEQESTVAEGDFAHRMQAILSREDKDA